MQESDPSTFLDRTGRETINLLRYSKIDNDDLETKFKFLADTAEKVKLKKRKMTGGQEDAKVSSKKARYGCEEILVYKSPSKKHLLSIQNNLVFKFIKNKEYEG